MTRYSPLAPIVAAILVLALVAACTPRLECKPAAVADQEVEKQAIRAVVSRMEAAWNRGDFHA